MVTNVLLMPHGCLFQKKQDLTSDGLADLFAVIGRPPAPSARLAALTAARGALVARPEKSFGSGNNFKCTE